jgi:GDP-4-dehydro-6-deoxy-D-mannose reductase
MRVFVTGAGGFVGRHLSLHLRQFDDQVIEPAGPEAPPGMPVLDVTDGDALRNAVEAARPDAIIHLAGFASVASSHREPALTFKVNTLGAVNLLAVAQQVAPKARILLIASAEMYGALPPGARATEDWPLLPLSPYAASKAAAELAGFQFHRSSGLEVISARPFNHIGSGQRRDFVVPSFAEQIAAIKKRNAPPLLRVGDLSAIRDFSHVADVVEAYRLLLVRGEPGQAYNVCSGQGRTIRSILDEMLGWRWTRPGCGPSRCRASSATRESYSN